MYYIAGPLFNEGQIEAIREIEDMLDQRGEPYFTPREYGVIADEPMTPQRMKRIYQMNVDMVALSHCLIAILDDRDSGTIFEIGYAAARQIPIITFSNQGHGINVMLKHAVKFHCNGMDDLEAALNGHGNNELEVSE